MKSWKIQKDRDREIEIEYKSGWERGKIFGTFTKILLNLLHHWRILIKKREKRKMRKQKIDNSIKLFQRYNIAIKKSFIYLQQ